MFESLDDPIAFTGIPGARARVEAEGGRQRRRRRQRRVAGWGAAAVAIVVIGAVAQSMRSDDDRGQLSTDPPDDGAAQVVLETDDVDPWALDYFAPVSGPSWRNGQRLFREVVEVQWERTSACMVRAGFEALPPLAPSNDRAFAFPDPEDLLAHGFRTTVAAGENEAVPGQDDPQWQLMYGRCDAANAVRPTPGLDSWYQEVDASMARPEEVTLWPSAAECLEGLGYEAGEVVDESTFLGAVQADQMQSDDPAEMLAIDLAGARDYVTCGRPVWEARTIDLTARRDAWLATHRAEVIDAQLRLNEFFVPDS